MSLKSLFLSESTLPLAVLAQHLDVQLAEVTEAARDLGLPADVTYPQAEALADEFDDGDGNDELDDDTDEDDDARDGEDDDLDDEEAE